MTWYNHAAVIVPVAHATAANRLLNVIFSDTGDNLARHLSPSGELPATHNAGSLMVDESWLGTCQTGLADKIDSDVVAPPGGWPWMDGETEILSKADAMAAANALIISVKSMDVVSPMTISQLAGSNFAAVYATENLALINEEEE
jgi:hypothetical protein